MEERHENPSSPADTAQPSPVTGAHLTSGTSAETVSPLNHENVERLANEKFWAAIDAFVTKYRENPSQTLLLSTLVLLGFIPLSAPLAILFFLGPLARTLLVFPALLYLSASLVARCFKSPTSPQSSVNAGSSSINHGPQSPRNGRSPVFSKLLNLRVILPIIAIIILASRVVFLLRVRRSYHFKFPIIGDPFRRYHPPYRASVMDLWGFFVLLGLVGYVGYRLGSACGHQRASSSPSTIEPTSSISPPSNTPNTQDAPLGFAHLNEHLVDAITPLWKLIIAGALKSLVALHKFIVWLIEKTAEDVDTTLGNERNEASRTMDAKKSTTEDDDGYEMLAEGGAGGSSSAFEPEGSLSERKGRATVGLEEEQL